jgi:hypothetical protein
MKFVPSLRNVTESLVNQIMEQHKLDSPDAQRLLARILISSHVQQYMEEQAEWLLETYSMQEMKDELKNKNWE